ncbi:hypothetical protein [Paraburkholderia aromaticivorans]|uniref:hypothetical protein n=1 Tax=Paraburkholderia aromaticivorans TaxID=2026199 RepID=UPI0012FE6CD9|nr:hypothetical protein [Paraburkholderia aromaticivorans]
MFTMDFSFVRRARSMHQRKAQVRRQRHNFEIKQYLRPAIQPSRLSIPLAERQSRQKEQRTFSRVARIETKTTARLPASR